VFGGGLFALARENHCKKATKEFIIPTKYSIVHNGARMSTWRAGCANAVITGSKVLLHN